MQLRLNMYNAQKYLYDFTPNNVLYEFKVQKELARTIMKNEPRARNDDKYLTLRGTQHFCKMYIDYKDLSNVPPFYNWQRYRQIIQHKDNELLPTNDIIYKKRFEREGVVRNIIHEV